MINSYIKSLKFVKHLILKIPSNPRPLSSLHLTEKPFNQTCTANQLSSFCNNCKIAESTKVAQKSEEEMD